VLALALTLILKKPADKIPPADPAVIAAATPQPGASVAPPKVDSPSGTSAVVPAATPAEGARPADNPATGAAPANTPGTTAITPANGASPPANAGGAQIVPPADTKVATAPAKPEPTKAETSKAEAAKLALLEGRLNLSVQPWGDVFVNGKSIGVSPPLKQYKLAPGKYRIEVKNTSFTPFSKTIEIKPKEDVSITHKFQ